MDNQVIYVSEDAHFYGINCTHALIRWLPQQPDLARIDLLLQLRHMSAPMKGNIFWALFRRYGIYIPSRFARNGLFEGAGLPAWASDKSWVCEQAIRAFNRLLLENPGTRKRIYRAAGERSNTAKRRKAKN